MQRRGWTLLFHDCLIQQLQRLYAAAQRAQAADPAGFRNNADVKLFKALVEVVLEVVPGDPSRDQYRQGNTLGETHRHWRRAKIGQRFRVFFRYDSIARVIVYAWVNDAKTLPSSGSNSDPYAVFEKMLGRGNPPDEWDALVRASKQQWAGDD